MKKAEISCWSSNDGEYLFRGNCFENELLEWFEECKKYSEKDKWYLLLTKHLKEHKGKNHPQDILDEIFREKISIDFDFADKLKLFDIIEAECFIADGELGDAILQLCVMAELRFIVSKRCFTTTESITINFEVCNEDYDYQCHKALITQTIKS